MTARDWESLTVRKRVQREAAIAKYQNARDNSILERKAGIIELTTSALLERINKKEVSAVDAFCAFADAAIEAHQQTNCLTEIMFDQGLARAPDLDTYILEHGHPLGPLHGLPISLKDQFDVAGVDSTLGYAARVDQPARENACIVSILLNAGANPFVKTNLPQTIMWCETDNPLFGRTENPWKDGYMPGGSSGGEGALIALRGSSLGIATDIGGSIRIPAAMCGLYGLKPSHGRFPYYGTSNSQDGQETVRSVVGPIARSVEDLELVTRVILAASPWTMDPSCIRQPWSEERHARIPKMRIGVMWDNGVVQPIPPITRTLEEVVSALIKAGHEVVDWAPTGHKEAIAIQDQLYVIDGGEDIFTNLMEGEPIIPHVQRLLDRGRSGGQSIYKLWQLHREKLKLQKAYLDRWEASGSLTSDGQQLDFLLMPTVANVAVPHTKASWIGYTKMFNMLDYTAASFPAGRVDVAMDVQKQLGREFRNEHEKKCWDEWNVEEMRGLPVGLQLVGRRLDEERVLQGMKQVIEAHRYQYTYYK